MGWNLSTEMYKFLLVQRMYKEAKLLNVLSRVLISEQVHG